jgi:lipid-binding SYLF domain-containing protein
MAVLTALLGWTADPVSAAPHDRSTLADAIDVLDDLAKLPEKCVPPALMRDAEAVIIAPNVVKGGFVIAGRRGHGVLVIKDKDGNWGNPVFVTLTGGSVGLQVGVQATDMFLVIKNRRSLDRIMRGNGKLTLGADASVAAGPLGRQASADTDAQLRAEILSYSRNRGAFVGVAVEGDTLRIDWEANERCYGKGNITVADIVGGKVAAPESVATLRAALAKWPDRMETKRPAYLELPPLEPKRPAQLELPPPPPQ